MPSISVAPNKVFNIFGIDILSAHISTLTVSIILILLSIFVYKNLKTIPNNLQVAIEEVVLFFYNKSLEITKNIKQAKRYTALILSLFLFIFISNQFTLIPLVQSVIINKTNVFSNPTAHFSQTIALALTVVILSNAIAFYIAPIKHFNNITNLLNIFKIRSLKQIPQAILDMFLGLLNIIGEFSKVISLSARLFGNIFAGEVTVVIIASLSIFTYYLVPVPFIAISIFSGIIQAFVFAFLSFSFIQGSVKSLS